MKNKYNIEWHSNVVNCQLYKPWKSIVLARLLAYTPGSVDSKWPVFFLHPWDFVILCFIYSMIFTYVYSCEGLRRLRCCRNCRLTSSGPITTWARVLGRRAWLLETSTPTTRRRYSSARSCHHRRVPVRLPQHCL